MRYRMLCPGAAIMTIDEEAYTGGGFSTSKHGNGYVKTLIVGEYSVYEAIRKEYHQRRGF